MFTDFVPGVNVEALALDPAGNIYASGPLDQYRPANSNTMANGATAMKIDPGGQKLLYNIAVPAVMGSAGTATALAVDPSGAAYLAGSSASIRVPEPAYVSGAPPNPFLIRIDPNPDQCDLEVDAQPAGATYLPGTAVLVSFTIVNHGPAAADNVVFYSGQTDLQLGGQITSCVVTGAGICDVSSGVPRVWFPSIPAGATEQVQFQVLPYISPIENVQLTATAYTSTSDTNAANNTATDLVTPNYVTVYVTSVLQYSSLNANVPYTISGPATQPIAASPGLNAGYPSYAAPNSSVTISWPTPYANTETGLGPVRFLQWLDGNTDNPRTFNIGSTGINLRAIFQIFQTPELAPAGVVNAAGYQGGSVAPGEIIALFGFNLGDIASAQIVNNAFSTSIGKVSLTFDGHPAPLIYTGGTQTAAVAPWEIAGQTSTNVQLTYKNNTVNLTLPVAPAVPALFTADSTGVNQASALNQDASINSASNPAHPGSVIVLYGTGEGLVSPVPNDGALSPYPAATPQLPIRVTIGGLPAQVTYAGEAPTLISGVIQIDAVIPSNVPTGDHVPVVWSAGNFSSQQGVTIAIQ